VPDLTCIAAHFGVTALGRIGAIFKAHHVWFDTSSALFALSPEQARAIIDAFGYERSSWHGSSHVDHQGELARFLALKLPRKRPTRFSIKISSAFLA
jgi:hypothetical protein